MRFLILMTVVYTTFFLAHKAFGKPTPARTLLIWLLWTLFWIPTFIAACYFWPVLMQNLFAQEVVNLSQLPILVYCGLILIPMLFARAASELIWSLCHKKPEEPQPPDQPQP